MNKKEVIEVSSCIISKLDKACVMSLFTATIPNTCMCIHVTCIVWIIDVFQWYHMQVLIHYFVIVHVCGVPKSLARDKWENVQSYNVNGKVTEQINSYLYTIPYQ